MNLEYLQNMQVIENQAKKPISSYLLKNNNMHQYNSSLSFNSEIKKQQKTYSTDQSWKPKKGTQGKLKKMVLKQGIAPCPWRPQAIIEKLVTTQKEEEKKEIQKEILINNYIKNCTTSKIEQCLYYQGFTSQKNGRYCLYFEFCEEGNLADLLLKKQKENCKLTDCEILDYFEQILLFLLFCKSHDTPHRDLKLENILIKNGTLKLSDYGEVRLEKSNFLQNNQKSKENQDEKQIPMKSEFCAPEISYSIQRNSEEYEIDSYAANIYSFGLIMASFLLTSPIFEVISKLSGKTVQALRKQEAFIMNKNKVIAYEKHPSEKIVGPFDEEFEKAINVVLATFPQNNQMKFIKSITLQMLQYNPNNRPDLMSIAKQFFHSGFSKLQATLLPLFNSQQLNSNKILLPKLKSDLNEKVRHFCKKIAAIIKQTAFENKHRGNQDLQSAFEKADTKLKTQLHQLFTAQTIERTKFQKNEKNWFNMSEELIDATVAENSCLEKGKAKAIYKWELVGPEYYGDETFWSQNPKYVYVMPSWMENENDYPNFYCQGDFGSAPYIPPKRETYWELNDETKYFKDEDNKIAIRIAQDLALFSGCSYSDCLKMLHSNLWNIETSFMYLVC